MNSDIINYNQNLESEDEKIAIILSEEIFKHLAEAENKIWHTHPIWFLMEIRLFFIAKVF